MSEILIIGNGFVGKNLFRYFTQFHNTELTDKSILNLSDKHSIDAFFSNNKKYDIIIYSAGIKDIKLCEREPILAHKINSDVLIDLSRHISNEKFVYISTDYVFDGKHGIYLEKYPPNPLTIYGQSKLAGEENTLNYFSNGLVVRTSGLYGKDSPWMKWLFNELDNNREVECYEKLVNSPTYVMNFAEMLEDVMFDQQHNVKLIHLAGFAANRYYLYKEVAKTFNKNDKLLIRSSHIPDNFPVDISLNCYEYTSLFGGEINSIPKGLQRYKDEN